MNRIKLSDRVLPTYTKGEEIFNMTSHIVGGALGIAATTLCIIFAAKHNNVYGIISSAIYGFSMILLYTMSSIYHGLRPNKAKRVFQVLDHCSIFLLIAGTYTPYCLVTLRGYNKALGWTLFGVVWGMAVIGIVLNSIDIKKYKIFSMICYLIMGWCILVKAPLLPKLLGLPGFILLLAGGIAYTIGAVFYGFGKKKKYIHSVFHMFILLGSILQFFSILLYVI
ncbi:MAG: hemolysin III family protein [Clostridia bacterium]|nr:hemolysin III family protein [Clostridia bacterium]